MYAFFFNDLLNLVNEYANLVLRLLDKCFVLEGKCEVAVVGREVFTKIC